MLLLVPAVALCLVGCAAAKPPHVNSTTVTTSSSPTKASDWYSDAFGTFDTFTKTGTGAGTIVLPAGVRAGIITISVPAVGGDQGLSMTGTDAKGENTGGIAAMYATDTSAVVTFGIGVNGAANDPATTLLISASSAWSMTFKPMSSAATLPLTGQGDGVFRYDGPTAIWTIKNTDPVRSNFIVSQEPLAGSGLVIDDFGTYQGTESAHAGPSIVSIASHGTWTITAG
jgi:hypothetical protein